MKQKKKIKKLEAEISKLKKVIKKGSVTIQDSYAPNQKIVMSFRDGTYSVDKITTSKNIENITSTQNP